MKINLRGFFGLIVVHMLLLESKVKINFHYAVYSKLDFGNIQFTDTEVYHLVQLALNILKNSTFSHFILAPGSD